MERWRLRSSVGCSTVAVTLFVVLLGPSARAQTNLRVSARQSSFRLEASSKQEGADVWNAAAVYHPTLGWVATATHSACFWAWCGIFEQTPRPWVAFLGKNLTPDLQRFDEYGRVWQFDNVSLAEPFQAIGYTNESLYAPLDYRPFIWNGSIFVGFSLRVAINYERMAIAELNPQSTTLRLHQIFDKSLRGDINVLPGTEKNWAFFERDDSLLILYKIFPCTHIFEFQAEHPRHAEEKLHMCYKDKNHAVRDHTLLDIEAPVHISGHPVLWEKEGEPDEMLMMVHVRDTFMLQGYNHWLLRMDPKTHQVTHISYGIIIGAALQHAAGHIPNVVIVGSISIVNNSAQTYLVVFGGEGDQYSIHERINLSTVAWLDIRDKTEVSWQMLEREQEQAKAQAQLQQQAQAQLQAQAQAIQQAQAQAQLQTQTEGQMQTEAQSHEQPQGQTQGQGRPEQVKRLQAYKSKRFAANAQMQAAHQEHPFPA